MDAKDLLILQELDLNTRQSITQLGKKIRISKETVQYRIQKLKEKEILKGFWAVPKISNKYSVYKVLIKHKGLDKEEKEKFEEFTKKSKVVSWFAKTTGSWSYILTIISSKDWENSLFLKELSEQFSEKFIDIQILKSIGSISLNEKYLFDNPPINPIYCSFLNEDIPLNETEKKIIKILTKNSRCKFVEISKKLSLTPEAIGIAYRSIMKKGALIDLKPRINHSKLGLAYYHLMLSVANFSNLNSIREYFITDKYTVFLMNHVGKYQLHVEIVCEPDKINNIIEKFLEKFSNDISDYDLCKVEKEHKIRVNS